MVYLFQLKALFPTLLIGEGSIFWHSKIESFVSDEDEDEEDFDVSSLEGELSVNKSGRDSLRVNKERYRDKQQHRRESFEVDKVKLHSSMMITQTGQAEKIVESNCPEGLYTHISTLFHSSLVELPREILKTLEDPAKSWRFLKILPNLKDSWRSCQILKILEYAAKSQRFLKILPNPKEYFKETLILRSVLEGPLRNSFKILKDFAGWSD